MNKIKIIILILLISNGVFAYLYVTSNGDGRESFGDKHEWGILQLLEYNHRQKPITKIEFFDIEGYHIICIPSESGHRVWIMLNPKHPPYYKQMPQNQYALSSD